MRGFVVATALTLFALTSAAYADCSDSHKAAALSASAEQAAPTQTQAAKPQADKVAKTETKAQVKQVAKVKAQPQDQKVASTASN